ncbi:MAG: transketolase [Bacillota bacterium]
MLELVANTVRGLSADSIQAAQSGHPGLPLGCAEIGTVLFNEVMDHNPDNPEWADRDRFVLSAGHGSMLLYSLLHLTGYDLSVEDLKNFRQLGSKTPGHPEYEDTPGVETTTGPLGQGFANAVGMAVSERKLAAEYNTDEFEIVDHYTYTLLGDGCMMEGIVSEAASLAGHLGLGKLIAIYDDNQISIAGDTDLTFTEDVAARFEAYDWHVIETVDGHDLDALRSAIAKAKEVEDRPTLIVANTEIAWGAPTKAGTSAAHGAPLGDEEIKGLKENLGFPTEEKFYIPEEVKEFKAKKAAELKEANEEWDQKFAQWAEANPELKAKWDQAAQLELPADLKDLVNDLEIETPIATRKAAGATLREIADQVPYLVGGSADLAPSNKTYLDKYGEIQQDNYSGRNFRFGVREHAMGAIANGISLHGGLRPFVATFHVFTDYFKAAIRMAALMKQPVVYVLTHDSIYVGEDGPTHQPIEHTESLRLIPNLEVIRPADAEEAKAAWVKAMERTEGPTALVLTRQNLPAIERDNGLTEFDKGGYVVKEHDQPEITLIASGSEVSLATAVAKQLEAKGEAVRVVSVPSREQFIAQGQDYVNQVLGSSQALRVVMEAGVSQGWYQLLGDKHHVVDMTTFGASGSGAEVAKHFGFDVEKIVEDILSKKK